MKLNVTSSYIFSTVESKSPINIANESNIYNCKLQPPESLYINVGIYSWHSKCNIHSAYFCIQLLAIQEYCIVSGQGNSCAWHVNQEYA